MKKFNLLFQALAFVSLVFITHQYQAQCSASFVYSINPGGVVSFSSTSVNSNSATVFSWGVNGVFGTYTGPTANITFSVSGNYIVTLQMSNASPSCTSGSSQTVIVNNATCVLNANFYISQGSNGAVTLNNASWGTVPGTTYLWDFGDNSPTSTLLSPAHTYSADGLYTATLTANNNFTNSCTSVKVLNVQVCSYSPPAASYNYTLGAGGNVVFNSSSTGVNSSTTYTWTSYVSPTSWSMAVITTSTGVNLTQFAQTFTVNGLYPVNMSLMNPSTNCSASTSQTILVNNTYQPCNLSANFSTYAGSAGLINFNNGTSGSQTGATYFWSFGDGATSTATNPVHTYSADGAYTATLVATLTATNNCISTIVKTVKVCSYNPINASFLYTINGGGNVTFTSTSTGPVSGAFYNWVSAPGSNTFASGINVTQSTITFTNSGWQVVNLEITDPLTTCIAYASQTIVPNVCTANATFSMMPTGTPQVWNVVPASPGNVVAAVWNWGDNSSSSTLYTSHSYSAAGIYTICLSVTVSCGATNSYCNSYSIYRSTGSNDIIQVDVIDPATVGIKNNSAQLLQSNVSPNPNKGMFNLSLPGVTAETNVLVYDVNGKIIYQQKAEVINSNFASEVNLGNVPAGIYFLEASSGGASCHKKIIVER